MNGGGKECLIWETVRALSNFTFAFQRFARPLEHIIKLFFLLPDFFHNSLWWKKIQNYYHFVDFKFGQAPLFVVKL